MGRDAVRIERNTAAKTARIPVSLLLLQCAVQFQKAGHNRTSARSLDNSDTLLLRILTLFTQVATATQDSLETTEVPVRVTIPSWIAINRLIRDMDSLSTDISWKTDHIMSPYRYRQVLDLMVVHKCHCTRMTVSRLNRPTK